MFYGRKYELEKLNNLMNKSTSSLVIVNGRRRIGKSALVDEFSKKFTYYFNFQGLAPRYGLTNKDQLNNISNQIKEKYNGPKFDFSNWLEAFNSINEFVKNKKALLFLDEISWMGSFDPDFSGILKIAWDTIFKKNDKLILIICGSVSSWIENNILNNTGFVGRISLSLTIKELPLNICNYFWINKATDISFTEKLKYLMVTGGIPKYLEELRINKTAEDNIKNLCFSPDGILLKEFDNIFNDIFNKRSKIYKEIINTLVSENLSGQEIANKLKKTMTGTFIEYLNDLELSGFIKKYNTWDFKGKKTKIYKYRIIDNYIRFYLKYIAPNSDKIENNLYKFTALENLNNWNTILGFQFENLVMNNLEWIIKKLKIDYNSIISASPYIQNKTSKNKGGCQFDLIIYLKNNTIYICEMKFKKQINNDIIEELKSKIKILKRPKYTSIRKVLIYSGELNETVIQSEYFDEIISINDCFIDF